MSIYTNGVICTSCNEVLYQEGEMKRRKATQAFAILLAMLITFTLAIAVVSAVETEEAEDGQTVYNRYRQTDLPDHYADQGYEPYGYGKNVPFYLNAQQEILFYQTSPDSSGDINTFYDKLKSENTGNVMNGSKLSAMKAPPDKLKKAYFVQSVAFDPAGTSRKDHLAFIGVYYQDKSVNCYVWVYDTVNRKWTSEFDLGKWNNMVATWMEDTHITDYQAVHFLSITAGDYDGDGKETLVAYCALNGGVGYSLYELDCRNPDFKIQYHGDKYRGNALAHDCYGSSLANENTINTKMACELDTGDLNGDGLDDLVALTYKGSFVDKGRKLENYRPIVRISSGVKGGSGFTQKCDYEEETWHWKEGWWYRSQVSPGMSVGDVDHDGLDEVVTSGTLCLQKKKSESTTERAFQDFYPGKQFICVIGVNEKCEQEYTAEFDANAWTESGFYKDEDIWNKTAVECVAVNGPGNAEMFFIGGSLYKLDGGIKHVHTPAVFGSSSDNLSDKASTNMFIQSTAAGNFDGNGKGYEQVVFIASMKTQSKRSYDYTRGIIGGKKYNDMLGTAREYYSTGASSMDDDDAWPGKGKDNASGYISEHQGLNCIVVACDCDNDGVLARYKEKSLIYADPEIMCVLQAPPYFEQMSDHMTDTSSTEYTITNSYEFESSKSDSVSYGVGVVAGMESPAIQMEVTAGYAMDWTKEFKQGLKKEVSAGWVAQEKDIVVLMRKPVVSYDYQIQSKDGTWGDECIVITVPCEPDYQTMSIDVYNAFADIYNNVLAKYTNDFHKMDKLDNKWLGHEGDPKKYIKWTNSKFRTDNAYKILQSVPMNLGHSSEAVKWGQVEGSSVGVSESMSHGFTYDATIAMGPNAGAASVYVGLSTSLQYMSGNSTSETKTKETGVACQINSIKANTPKELKPGDYNFSFKMARWPSGLKRYVNGKPEDVPVYGYALSGVTVPAEEAGASVEDQIAASAVEEKVAELPAPSDVSLADEADIQDARTQYNALSDDAKNLVDETGLTLLESRIELLKHGPLDLAGEEVTVSGTMFTYNGEVQRPVLETTLGFDLIEGTDYVCDWSDAYSTKPGTYTVAFIGKDMCTGNLDVFYEIGKGANTLTAKGKTVKVKASAVKKKAKTLKRSSVITVKDPIGKVTYAKSSGNKKITVNKKNGNITVKKGLKKGTYKVKVKVKSAGDALYDAATKTVTVTIRVR